METWLAWLVALALIGVPLWLMWGMRSRSAKSTPASSQR